MPTRDHGKTVTLTIRVTPVMLSQLHALARENDRTTAGEIRMALRRHLVGRGTA